ncbi:MAG: fimbrial protein, partial [Bacteroidales bacterium]
MKSNVTRYFLALILFLVCVSCADTDFDGNTQESDTISFKVETNSATETRATEPGDDLLNENKIDRLDVIFFNGETNVLYPTQDQLTFNPTTKVLTIKVSNSKYQLFNGTTSYKRVVFANLPLDRTLLEGKTYSQIRALVAQSDFTLSQQPDFIMEFTDNTTLAFAHPVLATANLKRAAVKVRTSIKRLDAPTGYTALKAEVQFTNYLDKTTLTDGAPYVAVIGVDYKTKAYTQIGMPAEAFDPKVISFLTYENDWTYDRQREPFIRVKVRWKKNSDNTEFDGYYKAPFSYLNSPNINDGLAFKLLRNTIYDIGFNISGLGSSDPENPETIASNFTLKDWTSKEILASFL